MSKALNVSSLIKRNGNKAVQRYRTPKYYVNKDFHVGLSELNESFIELKGIPATSELYNYKLTNLKPIHSNITNNKCMVIPKLSLNNNQTQWCEPTGYTHGIHKEQLYFEYGTSALPKEPEKKPLHYDYPHFYSRSSGEDSYFIRVDSMGIADGVGGWKRIKGANSAFYSLHIMHYAALEIARFNTFGPELCRVEDIGFELEPKEILKESYLRVKEITKNNKIKGSSTACIAILKKNLLKIANLGDCGVIIIRNEDIVFRTEEQQHSFNFPYQLGTSSKDLPQDAQSFSVKVEKGDIIIMGSDGLFDNLFEKEIIEKVNLITIKNQIQTLEIENESYGLESNILAQEISSALAQRAKEISQQKENCSPFSERACKSGHQYKGGKKDDITVLVAIVNNNVLNL